ncbi:MAG: TRAP transporter TatT component family protein [Acidobacteriota bacterium]
MVYRPAAGDRRSLLKHGSGRSGGWPAQVGWWRPEFQLGVGCLMMLLLSGCSIRQLAVNSLANALASGTSSVFTTDDDPELVGEALPFAIKTLEALAGEAPENVGLLIATCQGFLLYSTGYVDYEADRIELTSYREAERQRQRALKLYQRARGYCVRALELEYPGAEQALIRTPEEALADARVEDIKLFYWTAGAWGSVIASGLDRPELLADLPAVQRLLQRALELDPDFDRGALHEAMMRVEIASVPSGSGSLDRARQHYERALELNGGQRASLFLAWAEAVSVQEQDREQFEQLLQRALAVDVEGVNSVPGDRLLNIISQQRAQWLLDQVDELFL